MVSCYAEKAVLLHEIHMHVGSTTDRNVLRTISGDLYFLSFYHYILNGFHKNMNVDISYHFMWTV